MNEPIHLRLWPQDRNRHWQKDDVNVLFTMTSNPTSRDIIQHSTHVITSFYVDKEGYDCAVLARKESREPELCSDFEYLLSHGRYDKIAIVDKYGLCGGLMIRYGYNEFYTCLLMNV